MAFADIQLIPGPSLLRPTLTTVSGKQDSFQVQILNEQGCPVDLSDYVEIYDNPVGGACVTRQIPITQGILFTVRSFRMQTPPEIMKTVEIVGDPADGVVLITLEACDIKAPGLYLAELSLVKDAILRRTFEMYLEAAASLLWQQTGQPITISEIRLWARDNSPEDNFLLDEVEYKDSEIVAAIWRAIDLWNSTPPVMNNFTYTPTTFPSSYRSQWIDVTIGFLMGIAAQNYLRNALNYQAGGVQIDDKRWKYEAYLRESQGRIQGYTNWMKDIKVQLNAGQAWGRTGYVSLP